MTLEEYEKVLEEKRKALLSLKAEERKVGLDKDLQSMQQLSSKKSNDEIFIKLVRIISFFECGIVFHLVDC
jgi:plasminogen activator inhibitor 1 RNA-binding protein